jgi:hypothetical protein
MPHFTESEYHSLAETTAQAWNRIARKHGWPASKTPEQVLRTPQLLNPTLKRIQNLQNELLAKNIPRERCNLASSETIEHILCQWNWSKSPAPLRLINSDNLWNNLKYQIVKLKEEEETLQEEFLQRLLNTTKKEWSLQRKQGKTVHEATKGTKELLQATGKWGTLTPQQKLEVLETLENLEKLI